MRSIGCQYVWTQFPTGLVCEVHHTEVFRYDEEELRYLDTTEIVTRLSYLCLEKANPKCGRNRYEV